MRLPEHLKRALAARSQDPRRQRVILALLLRQPLMREGPHRQAWRPSPVVTGDNPGRCPALGNKSA